MKKNKNTSKRVLQGKVLRMSNDSSVVVEVTRKSPHSRYNKVLSTSKKYMAHTNTEYKPGEEVRIEQSRPISKNKHWRVIE